MKTKPRANLPYIGDWLQALPEDRREVMWCWVSSISETVRRGCRVVDLEAWELDGFLGEEWVPVAEHPEQSVWVVRRNLSFY